MILSVGKVYHFANLGVHEKIFNAEISLLYNSIYFYNQSPVREVFVKPEEQAEGLVKIGAEVIYTSDPIPAGDIPKLEAIMLDQN